MIDRTRLNDQLSAIWAEHGLSGEENYEALNDLTHTVADEIEATLAARVSPKFRERFAKVGRAVEAVAGLWAGEGLMPDWRYSEYARGQVETLTDIFGSPFLVEREWEDVKDFYRQSVNEVLKRDAAGGMGS